VTDNSRSSVRLGCEVAALLAVLALEASPALGAFSCDRFRRGDANGDGEVNLSDPVATLLALFASGPAIGCADAADADDSGSLELTDAIFTLGYLFRGEAAPSAPGPTECGPDATPDALSCDAQDVCDPPRVDSDFSGFQSFTFEMAGAFGFCPDIGSVYSASIVKIAESQYHLEMAVLREGTEGVDECLPPVRGSPCYVAEPLPGRDLSAEEVGTVLAEFRSVGLIAERDPICDCVAIDPCRVLEFQWDSVRASDFPCAEPHLDGGTVADVLSLLESLRA
jgi:hypothetical protein